MKKDIIQSQKSPYFNLFSAILFTVIFVSNTNIFALSSAENTLSQTDITYVGMDLYTTARKWEESSASGYTADALKGFSKKLDTALKNHPQLKKFFEAGYCDGCDSIVAEGFDASLTTYLRDTPPKTTSGERSYINILQPFLDKKIKTAMSTSDSIALDSLIGTMVQDISTQTKEQMNGFRDVSGMGLYYDGDVDNSPYDLLDDIRRIDDIFFRESPEFGDYKNTSANDAAALITGRVSTGFWGGGENYNIDLYSDIGKALGGASSGSSSRGGSGSSGEVAGDCTSGYCITIDFIQNSHYFLGGNSGGRGRNSFQGIFEEGLDWIIKNGDNRNFACKVSPTINTWESLFDLNVILKNLFSSGVHVFWEAPPFLQGFTNRNSSVVSGSTGGKTTDITKKENQQTLDSIKAAFKRRGMDADKPTNIKGSTRQAVEYVATANSKTNVPVSETVNSINRSESGYQNLLVAAGLGVERPFIHEKNVDSIKHMEKTFDEVTARTRLFTEMNKSMRTIFNYLLSKDDCQAS